LATECLSGFSRFFSRFFPFSALCSVCHQVRENEEAAKIRTFLSRPNPTANAARVEERRARAARRCAKWQPRARLYRCFVCAFRYFQHHSVKKITLSQSREIEMTGFILSLVCFFLAASLPLVARVPLAGCVLYFEFPEFPESTESRAQHRSFS